MPPALMVPFGVGTTTGLVRMLHAAGEESDLGSGGTRGRAGQGRAGQGSAAQGGGGGGGHQGEQRSTTQERCTHATRTVLTRACVARLVVTQRRAQLTSVGGRYQHFSSASLLATTTCCRTVAPLRPGAYFTVHLFVWRHHDTGESQNSTCPRCTLCHHNTRVRMITHNTVGHQGYAPACVISNWAPKPDKKRLKSSTWSTTTTDVPLVVTSEFSGTNTPQICSNVVLEPPVPSYTVT